MQLFAGQIKDMIARVQEEQVHRPRPPGQREKIRAKVDSGALQTVIHEHTAPDYPLMQTEASKQGMAFTSASGDLMPNLGQKILLVKTPAGHVRVMRNTVVNCIGALTATSRLVDEDNFVGHSRVWPAGAQG